MPPFDYSGFTNIGAGVAHTIAEKKKRDKEKEERERVARMLQQFGYPQQTIGDVAGGMDPNLAIGMADAQEKKFALQDKEKAAQDAEAKAKSDFENLLTRTRGMGPTSPEEASQRDVYAQMKPASQLNTQQEMLRGSWKEDAERYAKSQRNALMGTLEKDPTRKLTSDEIRVLYPDSQDQSGKWLKYGGMSLAEIRAAENKPEKDPRDRVFDIQTEQRKAIAKERGLKEGTAEWREYVYALKPEQNLEVVDEKRLRTEYKEYVDSYNRQLADPFRQFTSQGDPAKIEASLGGPVKTFGEWLGTAGAATLNPKLASELRDQDNALMSKIVQQWQLLKVDTSPEEFVQILEQADDTKPIMNDAMKRRILSMLR